MIMSLVDMLTQTLGGGGLGQIGRQIGADEKKTGGAVAAALPILLSALGRNASKPEGAQALSNALDKDHDGSLLDNLGGFLGKPEAGPGNGILKHVLGGRRPAVERSVGKATGLDAGSVGKLLMTLAPVVLGMLGKKKRQDNMDANGLASFLGQERQEAERKAPIADGLFGQLLDSDGDGDVDLGDIMKKGGGLLGGLFGGR
jgi:hypothetical protein